MADIFISYSSEDVSRIRPLAEALEKQGWSVFWDRKIPPGKTWREVIGEALESARSVIVAWSKTSAKSRWVQEEADWGLKRNLLIPIFIENVEPPLGFGAIQAANLTDWIEDPNHAGFQLLIGALHGLLGPTRANVPERLTSEPSFEKRRIDAVAPSNSALGQSMDVFIQVRFPDSEYLSIKDWPFKSKPSSIEQASKLTNVKYSKNSQGNLNPAYLRVKIVAPEFKVEGEAEKKIEIVPKEFSDLISFQLTPQTLGEQRIMVKVSDENGISVGELPVETNVNDKKKPIVREASIVVLDLNVLVLVEPAERATKAEAEQEPEPRKRLVERVRNSSFAIKGSEKEESHTPPSRQPVPAKAKPPETEPDTATTTEPGPPEPHRGAKLLKLSALAGVIVLIIVLIWWIIPRKGKIFIKVVPENATIQILDVNQPFRQGMELKPGKYQVQVSLQDYEKQDRWIELNANEEKRINFELKKIVPKIGRLFVETNPGNAAVRILDNQEKFNQGMGLKSGRYNLEASLDGYETQQQVVDIEPGEEKRINFRLAKLTPRVGRLFIETTPVDAKVSVLNIKSKFTQGIELEAGSYQVEVAAEGYETQRRLIDLEAGSKKQYKFELVKRKVQEPIQLQKVIKNSIGMELFFIPAGSFTMGSRLSTKDLLGQFGGKAEWFEDEHPPHDVKISQSFYLQTTEVSQEQWKKVMGDNPSRFKECGDDCPVENVSWDDVQQFLKKLNQIEKTKAYRLPSEAEWEYACRAGTTTHHSFGDDSSKLGEYAWYADNSNNTTHRVATKKPNLWGLFDMHCNVAEWVEDDHHDSYKGAPADGRAWVDNPRGLDRGARGGGWGGDSRISRSANRGGFRPDFRSDRLGFRLTKSIPNTP